MLLLDDSYVTMGVDYQEKNVKTSPKIFGFVKKSSYIYVLLS
jgi:hypothetical protein